MEQIPCTVIYWEVFVDQYCPEWVRKNGPRVYDAVYAIKVKLKEFDNRKKATLASAPREILDLVYKNIWLYLCNTAGATLSTEPFRLPELELCSEKLRDFLDAVNTSCCVGGPLRQLK